MARKYKMLQYIYSCAHTFHVFDGIIVATNLNVFAAWIHLASAFQLL